MHLKWFVHVCETTLSSLPLQVMFVDPSSKVDDLASIFGFDKSSVHILTKRSADRELVMFEFAFGTYSSIFQALD